MSGPAAANRLAGAASPYLRQHADNPVHWFEWGDEAFARAHAEDRPVFLSVGYSSCHWCHVMAHESFADPDTAALLNEHFVSVKVDREERPDVDAVYMAAVQAMTGRGGWPMSVFLTPDGRPFFAGTYWPRDDRAGMPGFRRVLMSVADVWRHQRGQIDEAGRQLTERLRAVTGTSPAAAALDAEGVRRAAEQVLASWDRHDGGFGQAPKFPQAMTIDFLLAHALRTGDDRAHEAAAHSLTAMARGGIYDHVGGGFARYATDRRWLVPHFEKMLYDNALLLGAYTHAAQVTGDPRHARVARETATWMLDELRLPGGGLACALDADSEGQEGKYYVWTLDEFLDALADVDVDARAWAARLGVTSRGNVADPHGHIPAGTSILHEAQPLGEDAELLAERSRVRAALAAVRGRRVRPGLDDKVLVSWNALALGSLAEAGAVFGEGAWIDAARDVAGFIAEHLHDADEAGRPRLWHRWTADHGAGIPAFAEDVAYLARALLVLYEADHDERWFTWATALAADADARFRSDDGTYYTTPGDAEQLIARPRELLDNATPSASSAMADVHLRLAALTGDAAHAERAEQTMARLAGAAAQMPLAFGAVLAAIERHLGGPTEVAVVGPAGDARAALLDVYRRQWRPGAVLAVGDPDSAVPLLHGRAAVDGDPTAYVCHHFACQRPVTGPGDLDAQLRRAAIEVATT